MSWNRRSFLGASASMALGSALVAKRAQAAETIPKRIIQFFTPHGTVWDRWRPTGTETSFDLSYILEPLAAFKSKLLLIDGVGIPPDGPGAPHTRGPAVLFTGSPLVDDGTFTREDCSGGCSFGWNAHHSVDFEIATRLGDVTPYKSLEFGVQSGGGFPGAFVSYSAPSRPQPPKQNPHVAFQDLFGSRVATETERAKTLNRRRDVLAAVQTEIRALRFKASRSDLIRLEAQAESIAEIQRVLAADASSCSLPSNPEERSPSSPGYRPWAYDRQIELAAASLACGLTRVVTIQFRPGENDSGAEGIYDWLGQTQEHHLSTHDGGTEAQDRITEIYRWYASRLAYLLERLDAYTEDDGTLLDHTMVVWGSEIGEGRGHAIDNIPFVLAGGGRAGLRTGRSLQFPAGTMNHRLLVSMCHFMGFSDVQSFGTLDTGTGPLAGLT